MWFDGHEKIYGTVQRIYKYKMTIKWEDEYILPKTWTLDGKWGGPESDGTVCVRVVTPLEELL